MSDMPPEVAARMEAWRKYGSAGPEHRIFDLLSGRWKAAVKSYLTPGTPAQESRGEAEFEILLGGNFLEQRFTGDMGGAPYQGRGCLGYDRYKKEYFQTWIDSFSTSLLTLTGQADASGRVISFAGPVTDLVTGRTGTMRQTFRITPERLDLVLYGPDVQGVEYKMMEIAYLKT